MPRIIRTVIIDENSASIDDLKYKLAKFQIVNVVGDATTGCSGIRLVQKKFPDLVFLNVEMPGRSGFDLIGQLKLQQAKIPFVIFVTIHPEFTLQALRTGAIDYLLKPVDENELQQAVLRAADEIHKNSHLLKIDHLLEYISKYKQLFLPSSTGYKTVNIQDIIFLQKNTVSGKVEVLFGEDDFLTLPSNYSMAKLAEILPRIDFFQIKRDVIINLKYLKEIEVFTKTCILEKGAYRINLEMSRRSLKEFKDRMVI